jgi:N-acetylmuramoyl-L-alanine amidase
MSYNYLTQFNSPNFTAAAQTASVWGVNRDLRNIAIHHWGDPNTNPTFEGVIAHLDDPNSGVSAHYVATGTGRRVACLVSPEDNSWSTMSDNPYCISIECDPRCRDEDYDVVAELVADIRSAYGNLPLVPHRQFVATDCPGNWDLGRIDAIAAGKVSQADWGAVTDLHPPVAPPVLPPVVPPVTPPIVVPPVIPPVVTPPVVTPPTILPPVDPILTPVPKTLGNVLDSILFAILMFIKQVLGVK